MADSSVHSDVTAVVPCFNYGAWVREAVDSLLAQEGGPPRVVVVDDGSTDPATVAVLDNLPVPVIRQANAGLSAARNTGFRSTDTPLLIALDADDRLPSGALSALKRPLDADPAVGFSYGVTRFFGDWEGDMAFPPLDAYRMLFRHVIGPVGLTRRALWEDVGGYDESPVFRAGYEDWDFWLGALERGWQGAKVEEVTFLYRRHGETMVFGARRDYRRLYATLRAKHAALYARRAELARASDAGPVERALLRYFWGPRPVPARVEQAIYRLVFRR
ncbi:MAG TPA: glycosyltransferase family A protein [Capillimicrobium sp.]